MLIDTFEYPPDPARIDIHKKANRIGKIKLSQIISDPNNQQAIHNLRQCSDCGRFVTGYPKFRCHESEEELEDRYGIHGPNCAIYLGFIKRLAIFLFICTLVFALPMFIINLKGQACKDISFCLANDAIHNWSLYNVRDDSLATLPHIILWFIFCLFIIVFNFYLTIYTLRTYRAINDKNITDSDYCILLRRLPDLVSENEIKDLVMKEIQRIKGLPGRQNLFKDPSIRDIIMIRKLDETEKSLKTQKKYFRRAAKRSSARNFVPAQLPRPIQFANAALVRFNSMITNKQIVRETQSLFLEKFLHFFCVFYNPKTQHKINQKNISLENAPHPSDMLWQNFGFSERSRILRKTILTIGAIIVLILSGAASLFLSYWMQLITNNQGERPVYLTIITVLIVLIFNRIIRKIVIYTTKIERLDTKTDKESQQISLIVFHESINLGFFSIVVPVLVQLPEYIQKQTTTSSSFPLVMFTTIIIQAIFINVLDFFIHFFEIKQKLFKWLDNKKISPKTQSQALRKFVGFPVPFVKCYAWNVKIIWFGFLYAVITPISVFIAFVGMTMSYYFERYLFNKKYSIPFYGGPRINYQMIRLLDWTPLIIGLFNLFVYKKYVALRNFPEDSRIIALIIVMIVIGCINLLVPWKRLAKRIIQKPQNNQDHPYNPNNLEVTYQQSNPFGRQTPTIFYRQPQTFESVKQNKFQAIYHRNITLNNPQANQITARDTQNFLRPTQLDSPDGNHSRAFGLW